MSIEERIREIVAETVRSAVLGTLEDAEFSQGPAEVSESWRSRLHRVHPDTRLSLAEVAEALGVSERTVRRYLAGSGERPELPHQRGPSGLSVRAGDLRTWIADVEGANRFRQEEAA